MDRRRIIILITITGIILLVIFFTLLLLNSESQKDGTGTKVPIISRDNSQDTLEVTQTQPTDKGINVSVSEKVTVTFNRPLTEAEQQSISVNTEPATAGTVTWTSDNRRLTYEKDTPFSSLSTYEFIVAVSGTVHSFTFTTTDAQNVSEEEALQIQTASDKDFADTWATIDSRYPWYDQLPLDDPEDKYFVYFDLDRRQIIAKLYADPSEVNDLQSNIQAQLQGIGVDLQTYPMEWLLQ